MTESVVIANPAASTPTPPNNSIFKHARYVASENPVTGLSFAAVHDHRVMRPDRALHRAVRSIGERHVVNVASAVPEALVRAPT